MASSEHLVVFGASGAIGSAICERAIGKGWQVTGVSRMPPAKPVNGVGYHAYDPFDGKQTASPFAESRRFNSICWAQGANINDSVHSVSAEKNMELYRANCLYILMTLKLLLDHKHLARGSRMCVISSIWQDLARQNKLSYCMTKAALQGLVLSASVDLASDGHLINAVLPGALETPMTRQNLTTEQIDRLTGATQFGRLATLDDVASMVCYLCSPENTGITGQFIAADLGFSRVRIV